MRRYNHTPWAFWRWSEVSFEGKVYLRRLHIAKTPWGAIMLHWILTPDPQPDPHDHPVSFLSLVLRGGYVERRYNTLDLRLRSTASRATRFRGHRHVVWWWNFLRASDVHRITSVAPRTVTLCFAGPKVREWGHHTPRGWVYWREYQRKREQRRG